MDTDVYFLGYVLPVCESEHTDADKFLILMGQAEEWGVRVGDPQWPEAEECAELCALAAETIAGRMRAREQRHGALRLATVGGVRVDNSAPCQP